MMLNCKSMYFPKAKEIHSRCVALLQLYLLKGIKLHHEEMSTLEN